MKKTVLLDTNVLVRYFLKDNPVLFSKAKQLFFAAQDGKTSLYLDEVVVAEIVWLLSSFYKRGREEISSKLTRLITQDWIVNPRKEIIILALSLYSKTPLSYIDCWVFLVSKSINAPLQTFDQKLKNLKVKD